MVDRYSGAMNADPAKRPPSRPRCSTCGKVYNSGESPAPPFCSRRCQQIDLGRWLDEAIELPHEGGPKMGEEPSETSETSDE